MGSGERMRGRVGSFVGTLSLAIALTTASAAPDAAAKAAPRSRSERACSRAIKKVERAKKLRSAAAAALLKRLHRVAPACAKPAALTMGRVDAQWQALQPVATRAVPRGVAMQTLSRYRAHLGLLQAVLAFKEVPQRAHIVVRVGELHENMARYLDEVGTGPDTIFLIKEKHALYHSRVVDLRERLKLDAEDAYQRAIALLKDASSKNETLKEAKDHLEALQKRYAERTPPPPPPAEPPEDAGVPVLAPSPAPAER